MGRVSLQSYPDSTIRTSKTNSVIRVSADDASETSLVEAFKVSFKVSFNCNVSFKTSRNVSSDEFILSISSIIPILLALPAEPAKR